MERNRTTIAIKVQPNASKNAITGFKDNTLCLKIAAPPVKGRANRELVSFLSRLLGVGRDSVTIQSGHTSRTKTIAVVGLDRQQILERLGAGHRA